MKLAIDASSTAKRGHGGIDNYIRLLIANLAGIDSENKYYICYKFSRLKNRKYFLPVPAPNFKIKIVQEPFSFIFDKIDLYHGTDIYVPDYKCKKIATIHDLFSLVSDKFSSERFRERKIQLYQKAVKRSDMLICVSESTKKDLMNLLDVTEERVRVIYEGVGGEYYPRDQEEQEKVRTKYNLARDYFLFVGVPSVRKNTPALLRCFSKIVKKENDSLQLALVGKMLSASEEISKLINEFQPRENLRVLNYVEENDLAALYSGAKALVFPSLYEGFGLPVLEAMACGAPVLTSNVSSLPEITGDAALLADPYNEEDIEAGMTKLLNDEGLRMHLKDKGFARAKAFSWRKMAEQTLECYRELCN